MQRIRHDEKQWANQTHGCFSVSVLLAGKKKRNSTSGKCVFADWQQQRQFPFIPNSIIFPYTHTHCLKADGQCWWWWWSLKSGKRWWWRSRRRCFLRNTFTLLFAWNSPSLHFTLNNSKKQPFFYLKPFLSLATLNLFRHFSDWTEKIEKEWKCVRVAIWSVLPPSHSFHCCSSETFFQVKVCV